MDRTQWSGRLIDAIKNELPPGTTIGFNYEDDWVWFQVSQPGDTTVIYQRALTALEATEK